MRNFTAQQMTELVQAVRRGIKGGISTLGTSWKQEPSSDGSIKISFTEDVVISSCGRSLAVPEGTVADVFDHGAPVEFRVEVDGRGAELVSSSPGKANPFLRFT